MRIEELIDLYGDGILRLCILYLGDRQLAEDAFQETLIKAWKKWDGFRGESSVKTWLTRIAVNTCRDMLRSGWFRTMRRSQPVETLFDLAAEGYHGCRARRPAEASGHLPRGRPAALRSGAERQIDRKGAPAFAQYRFNPTAPRKGAH